MYALVSGNRIIGLSDTEFACSVEVEIPEWFESENMHDYIIENGKVVYSRDTVSEVNELKSNLAATDYIACKIAEGAATVEQYAVELAQRQAWRDRINELEN